MLKLRILFFLCISIFSSCEYRDGENFKNEIPISELDLSLRVVDTNWNCIALSDEQVCLPEGWFEESQEQFLLLSQLQDSNPNTYFVIIKNENPLYKLDEYENQVIGQLVEDSIEVLNDYALTGLKYRNKKASFLEAYLEKDGVNYCAFSMLVEKNGVRYDFSLKVLSTHKEVNYSLFQAVLNRFEINGELLFDEKDRLQAIEIKKSLH